MIMPASKPDLLPCPFCEWPAAKVKAHEIQDACWFVECERCHSRGPSWSNPKAAKHLWNARSISEFREYFKNQTEDK